MRTLTRLAAVAAGLLSGSAAAHHSAAMFDAQKSVQLSGVVREFQWSNPHCYIQLVVRNSKGAEEEWSLEMGAPMYLYNLGWRRSTVKPGDRLVVEIAPLRNGDHGGLLTKATSADGRPLGRVVQGAAK